MSEREARELIADLTFEEFEQLYIFLLDLRGENEVVTGA